MLCGQSEGDDRIADVPQVTVYCRQVAEETELLQLTTEVIGPTFLLLQLRRASLQIIATPCMRSTLRTQDRIRRAPSRALEPPSGADVGAASAASVAGTGGSDATKRCAVTTTFGCLCCVVRWSGLLLPRLLRIFHSLESSPKFSCVADGCVLGHLPLKSSSNACDWSLVSVRGKVLAHV
jgi:hypothetical protein